MIVLLENENGRYLIRYDKNRIIVIVIVIVMIINIIVIVINIIVIVINIIVIVQ